MQENVEKAEEVQDIDFFDIENVDFTQRQERRRGSRRRGYRRIDDRNLVSRAQEESENIKKSAFEEGYRLGLEKAEADFNKFREDFSCFMNARKEVFEYIAPDILEISVDIAKTIVKKELEADPQVLINTILDVLRTVSKNEPKINIRVPSLGCFQFLIPLLLCSLSLFLHPWKSDMLSESSLSHSAPPLPIEIHLHFHWCHIGL